MTSKVFDAKLERRKIFIGLLVSIIGLNSFIIFSNTENKDFIGDETAIISSGLALGLALVVVSKQKLGGLHGITYASLAVGLSLWFVAEVTWTYYEIGLGIEYPSPSLIDVLWLTGYGFFAYHLFRTYKFFSKSFKPYIPIVVSLAVGIFLAYIIYLSIKASELSAQNDLMLVLVSIAYPVADSILMIPAITILSSLRYGQLTSTPWILLSSSLLIFAIADTGYAYSIIRNVTEVWIWGLPYNAGYLCITAALLWHNRFFIFSNGRSRQTWRMENR